ncbi:MAG: transglycosylase SLT domain-containing protein [Bacteroidota bacterium]
MDSKTLPIAEAKSNPKVTLTVLEGSSDARQAVFKEGFRIGRDPECQVVLTDVAVSKVHLEVFFEKGKWWARDLNSTNGTFSGKKKIAKVPLGGKTKLVLGRTGPLLTFEVEGAPVEGGKTVLKTILSPTAFLAKYLKDPEAQDDAGDQTRLIRRRLQTEEKKRSAKYIRIIAIIAGIALLTAAYAVYKHIQVAEQEKLAQDAFYEIKALDLAYAALKKQVAAAAGDSATTLALSAYRAKRGELTETYDKFLGELGVYSEGMDEKDKTIYHIARIFGECEIGMPEDFVEEVESYIDLWKRSPRLRQAMARAMQNEYPSRIAEAMISHDLPPQFFYLALQESEFDSAVVGPPTRFGIAKGMWQFMPGTAIAYGLKTGPLVQVPKPDPRDERQDVGKSTVAAAQYISDMYNTEAQASGLLVIAGYNWGHNAVKVLIRQMPENPRERNFWRFLTQHRDRIPKQTYDYVFYIFSAAVIGENPGLWGFNFDNPFAQLRQPNQADAKASGS